MRRNILEFNLTDPNKARYRRFCAEWSIDQYCRKALEELCKNNPHWGIKPCGVGLVYNPNVVNAITVKN